ncbi:MAG: ParB/RepB/Spo0J family partition protein [Candidatus Bathyarchaeota archaeon]
MADSEHAENLKQFDVKSVKIAEIDLADTRFQARLDFDDAELHELARDIEANGLRNPIGLWEQEDGSLIILYGFQRLRAFQLLNRTAIPTKVYGNLTLKQAYTQNLSDNIGHADLTDLEIGLRLRFFREEQGYGLEDLVLLLGKGEATVYNLLRLTELEQEIQRAVHTNTIGLQQALEIARFPDSKRLEILEKPIQNNLSVRDIKRLRTDKQAPSSNILQELSPEVIAGMIRNLSLESQKKIMSNVAIMKPQYVPSKEIIYDAVKWDKELSKGNYEWFYETIIKGRFPPIPKYGCEYSQSIPAREKKFICHNVIEYVVLEPPAERNITDYFAGRGGWFFWCKDCIVKTFSPHAHFHEDYYWYPRGRDEESFNFQRVATKMEIYLCEHSQPSQFFPHLKRLKFSLIS